MGYRVRIKGTETYLWRGKPVKNKDFASYYTSPSAARRIIERRTDLELEIVHWRTGEVYEQRKTRTP